MKTIFALVAAGVLGISGLGRAGTIDLPLYGFSMEGLDVPVSGGAPVTALMSFLPPSGGFAPNINVQIQPYGGSIEDFAKLSKAQFSQVNGKVVSEKMAAANDWVMEYTGTMQGKDLHLYARSVMKDGKVYVVTGTATEAQWGGVEKALRAGVDSFKLK